MAQATMNKTQAEALAKELIQAQSAYHNDQTVLMPDQEYDSKVQLLVDYEQLHGDLPINWKRIGAPVTPGRKLVQHVFPMQTLNSVHDTSIDAVREFVAPVKYAVDTIVVEPKWNGIAIALNYFMGRLTTAATRGDGTTGENVTSLFANGLEGAPTTIGCNDSITIHGELLLSKSQLNELNNQRIGAGANPYPNARHAVAHIARSPNATDYASVLSFRAYDIHGLDDRFVSQAQKAKFLNDLGFIYELEVINDVDPAELVYALYLKAARELEDNPFETDGMVYKVNVFADRKHYEQNSSKPGWAMAHKFEPTTMVVFLESIELMITRTGRAMPVSPIRTVLVNNRGVNFVSLKNALHIETLDIRVGDSVVLEKTPEGQLEVISVVPTLRLANSKPYVFPTHCPECGGFLTQDPDEKIHYCNNHTRCPPQVKQYWEYVTSKHVLDIQGLTPETLEKLIDANMLNILPDLWEITQSDLLTKAGMPAELAESVSNEIYRINTQIELWRVYTALGIRGVGGSVSKDLARAYPTIKELVAATKVDMEKLQGIGPILSERIEAYVQSEGGTVTLARLDSLLRDKFIAELPGDNEAESNSSKEPERVFLGTAAITGQFGDYTQPEVAEMVENVMFYRVVENVTKDTFALIVGDNPNKDKVAKAKRLGVHLVTGLTFRKF